MPAISAEVYSAMGLTDAEYGLILSFLGREPTLTELGMFAVMWSEHCGYKYSRPILKLFKRYRAAIDGAGLENAGIVDIGDGLGIAMKVESHNHPSAVEPYEGAATGVGGIIRDILTMGARPIAILDSLRFGPIRDAEADPESVDRNHYLLERVVAGIAGYGNCVGVPTVAGEVTFHARFCGNPLVNAMCVGIVPLGRIATASAKGPGNPVLYLGSSTGKDGIHGATFASESLGEDSDAKRPNVQIGDPFAEKSLIEATLEALETDAIVAIQDMGAAGLTCSTVEMASKGKIGMTLDLDLVPVRESDMTSLELMLSESQERMLAVVTLGREREVIDIFHKWGLKANVVGEVTADSLVHVRYRGEEVANLDPTLLTDQCPTYTNEPEEPAYYRQALRFDPCGLKHPAPNEALLRLIGCPNIASKRWVYQQYDQQVQTQTLVLPGRGDAAVLAPRGTQTAIALKIDGNARHVYFDPYVGGQLAVAEAARNVACVGAIPTAVTDGLNFGNPERKHVYWQFKRAVEGIAEACDALGTPVISGNVSFYNESDMCEVLPTPLIGMLGVLAHSENRLEMAPHSGNGIVALVYVPLDGVPQEGLGASEYLSEVLQVEDGCPVAPNLRLEKELCALIAEAADKKTAVWAHDLSEGGLGVALAEVSLVGDCGIKALVETSTEGPFGFASHESAALFGEVPGRVLIGIEGNTSSSIESVAAEALTRGLGFAVLGTYRCGGGALEIDVDGARRIDLPLSRLQEVYEGSIPGIMGSL